MNVVKGVREVAVRDDDEKLHAGLLIEAQALVFIHERNLDLRGGNSDPRGLGGGGGTKYEFTVSNASQASLNEVSTLVIAGTGTSVYNALMQFKEKSIEAAHKIENDKSRLTGFLYSLAGD